MEAVEMNCNFGKIENVEELFFKFERKTGLLC